eukprot:1730999-Prymnesium_polylepis.1
MPTSRGGGLSPSPNPPPPLSPEGAILSSGALGGFTSYHETSVLGPRSAGGRVTCLRTGHERRL